MPRRRAPTKTSSTPPGARPKLGVEKADAEKAVRAPSAKAQLRRDKIADAVIAILAEAGPHGVTHRKVDQHLGLPEGSTSFYFRRRTDLFKAGFKRMIENNYQRMQQEMAPLFEGAPSRPLDIDAAAKHLAKAWTRAVQVPYRDRIIVRFEFFIQATRDSELRKMQGETLQQLFDLDVQLFARMGAKNPRYAGAEFGSFRRGYLTTYVLVPSSVWGRALTPEYFAMRIRQIIAETNAYSSDLR